METIEASDYDELARLSEPQLSPTGERVAFVRRIPDDDESYEATVYVVPLGGGDPRQFTVAEGVDSLPRWSPSGDRLAFCSTRGADDDRTQLWICPADGGEARRVTQVVGGVGDIAWSPDGTRICFTQRVTPQDREENRDRYVPAEYEPTEPDPRVIDRLVYRANQQYLDGRRSHVYVLDVETALENGGEGSTGDGDGTDNGGGTNDGNETDDGHQSGIDRLTAGDRDFVAPAWGDDETIYYATKHGEMPDDSITWDLLEHDLRADESTTFTQTTGWLDSIAATTDGRVAYPYSPEENPTLGQTELEVHDRSTGDERMPTASLDRTVDLDAGFEWGPEQERLYFTTPDEGSVVLREVPGDASTEPVVVSAEDAAVDGFSVGTDVIATVQTEWDHPGDVFVSTRGGNERTRLTRINDDYLTDRAVAEPEELVVEHDGASIQGWVLHPPDFDPDDIYPLVVEIHGGPHVQWTTSGTIWHEFQTLAARGYVVFWCNPRGSTGYGADHASAIERDWGDVTVSDVIAGADELCDRAYVDESNQFVTGGSFGGFMTAWAVGHTDRFAGAVAQRGVYDLTGFYGSTDVFKLVEGEFDTTPWEEPAFLWEQSPVAHVSNVSTPTLVMHSESDYRTPANTAELFYRGLKKHEVDTRLVRYPREGHELSRSGEPGHVVDRIERIARWFDGYSTHYDDPPALERGQNEGLSMETDADREET